MAKPRTPIVVILLRIYFFVFLFVCGFAAALNGLCYWASGRTLIEWPVIFGVTVVLGTLFTVWNWTIVTGGCYLVFGGDPLLHKAVEQGYRPFWDSLPRFLNPSTDGFDGPEILEYACPACGMIVDGPFGVCPRCNYGADGDSSAYFDPYGNVPPPGVTAEEFARRVLIQRDDRL